MAKLIILALAFTALVAFATAHRTIVTTTVEREFDQSSQQQQQQYCSPQLQGQQFNQCQRYLTRGFVSEDWAEREPCCQEIENVSPQCQCQAVKEVLEQTVQQQQQQQQQQEGTFGAREIQKMLKRARRVINKCDLQTQQCEIGSISVSTTTISDRQSGGSSQSQQCQQVRQRDFNQCQRFIQQQIGSSSYGPLLMSINRQQQQQPQELRQCCNELENVQQQCQCDALQEVYQHAQQQMQQQQQQQQGGYRGGQQQQQQPQQMHQQLQQVIQYLQKQCNIQAQQCRIPSAMF